MVNPFLLAYSSKLLSMICCWSEFYPRRNTLQPMFILRHLHAKRPSISPRLYAAFTDFKQAQVSLSICVCMCAFECVCMCALVCVCLCVCVCVCVCVCERVCACVRARAHKCTHVLQACFQPQVLLLTLSFACKLLNLPLFIITSITSHPREIWVCIRQWGNECVSRRA